MSINIIENTTDNNILKLFKKTKPEDTFISLTSEIVNSEEIAAETKLEILKKIVSSYSSNNS